LLIEHTLETFEDTKGAIRIRISKKNRQHNDRKKKYKRTNNGLQNIDIKLKEAKKEYRFGALKSDSTHHFF
jgi:hypothetical protein